MNSRKTHASFPGAHEAAGLAPASVTQFNSQNNYDIILMDCQMPNKDGFEATRDIRQFESTNNKKRCPIVAITANTMHGDKDKCLAAGMDDFLSKPFKSHQIIDMINKWTVAS